MKTIKIYKNKNELSNYSTTVDDDIFEIIKHEKFYLQHNVRTEKNYVTFCNKKITGSLGGIYLHRFIMRLKGVNIENKDIDHINNNTFDNRLDNLRVATEAENAVNRSGNKNCKHGHKNISIKKDGSCQVIMMRNRKYYSNFLTKSLLEAIIYANIKRKELQGDFAYVEYIEGYSDEEILKATEEVMRKIENKNKKRNLK